MIFGQALVAADSMDSAIVQLTRAKECMPENPAIYLSLGDAYFKIGVKPLAISNYQKASELAPNNRDIQLKVARSLSSNKQYNEAIEAYIKAEKIDSTYPDPYLEHGRILVLAKFYRQAIPPLSRFVKLSPMHLEGSVLYAKGLFGYDLFAEARMRRRPRCSWTPTMLISGVSGLSRLSMRRTQKTGTRRVPLKHLPPYSAATLSSRNIIS